MPATDNLGMDIQTRRTTPTIATDHTTIASGTLTDPCLSFRARGLLGYLLAQPDSWTGSTHDIAHAAPEGHQAVQTAMSELERAGYLTRQRGRTERGTMCFSMIVREVVE
jgi:hypothetical protein